VPQAAAAALADENVHREHDLREPGPRVPRRLGRLVHCALRGRRRLVTLVEERELFGRAASFFGTTSARSDEWPARTPRYLIK